MPFRSLWPLAVWFLLCCGTARAAMPPDDLGRVVALKSAARRVVVIGPGAVETIFAIGASDRLVGRDRGADYPPAALKVPVVADFSGPFLERVVALRPDFMIVQGETWDKARLDDWQRKCGVPVAGLTAHTVEGVAQGILKIGAWLGQTPAATRLAQRLRQTKTPRAAKARGATPRCFFEVARSPLWTAGRGTLIDDVLLRAGLSNIARDIQGYRQIGLEALVQREPDRYIVPAAKGDKSDRVRTLRELQAQLVLRKLRCIKAGHVIVVPADWLLRPGPRLAQGIVALAQAEQALESAQKAPRGSANVKKTEH